MTTPATVLVSHIVVGERDRQDLGNVEALAASIADVGLLHPIVTTDDYRLVAGGRRLEAVKHLGWTSVPVTVVNLSTVEDVLRGEEAENTCRKPLSLIEASRARQRRAEALAPKAAERKAHGTTAPGRNAPPKLGEASDRRTAKVAAIGTGYSGSTLDKVDKVRQIAERGTLRQGRAEVPAPEPVREAARAAVDGMQAGTVNPSQAVAKVESSVEAYLAAQPEIIQSRLQVELTKAIVQAGRLVALSPETFAPALDASDWEHIRSIRDRINRWADAMEAARPKSLSRGHLTVIGGTR